LVPVAANLVGVNRTVLPVTAVVIAISALAASALLTQLVRRVAAGSGVFDVPNPRSSHEVPTPRGGGLAIVLVTTAGLLILALRGTVQWHLFYALTGGGLAVALIGAADDRRSLSAAIRLTVHFAAALWALAWLGGLPPLRLGNQLVALGWVGYLLAACGIVWAVNLFNFMDGIDGLAASEAIFIALGAALLNPLMGGSAGVAFAAVLFAAACGGFLLWNWPPASIFLGDVGSGYSGYVIVVLAVAATRDSPTALWVWLILGGVFFCDATVTLTRRVLRGERVYEAHRSHGYQWLTRRWGGHRKVTLAVIAVNLVWLLPWAALTAKFPAYGVVSVIAALAPLSLLAVTLGSGRREHSGKKQ
jgi:Fuc2NAc and GlcNAc transferase